jgi:hypothetical protein
MKEAWIEAVLHGFAGLHDHIVESLKEEAALAQATVLLRKRKPGLPILKQVQLPDLTRLKTIANLSLASDFLRRVADAVGTGELFNTHRANRAFFLIKELTRDYAYCLERYSKYQGIRLTQVSHFLTDFVQDAGWFGGSPSSPTDGLGGILCAITDVLAQATTSVDRFAELTTTIVTELLGPKARKSGQLRAGNEVVEGLRRFLGEATGGRPTVVGKKAAPTLLASAFALQEEQDELPARVPQPAPAPPQDPKATLKEAVAELDALVGLAGVKAEVKRLMGFLKIQQERRRHGLRDSGQSLHLAFTGGPGSGKTTVARIVGKILFSFGFLPTARLVKCSSSDLVGDSRSQTAGKVDQAIASALDGALFIDEAHTLADGGGHEVHRQEALHALLARMEEHRDRLVVIAAGRTEPMEKLLRNTPGLEGRFTRVIRFEDYPVADLCRLFEQFSSGGEYLLTPLCRACVGLVLLAAWNRRDERFANARLVRVLFEQVIDRHSQRLAVLSGDKISKEALATLDGPDVPVDSLGDITTAALDLKEARWDALCPACGTVNRGGLAFLGQRVRCKCGDKFVFPWWSPVARTIKGVPAELLACDKAVGQRSENDGTFPHSPATLPKPT